MEEWSQLGPEQASPPFREHCHLLGKTKEDGRILVAPLERLSLWEGTTYTVATRSSNRGEELKNSKQ